MTRIRTGIDLVSIPHLRELLRDGAMLDVAWTQGERDHAGDRTECLAAQWAAKEAVMKVLGKGIGDLSPRDIEVCGTPGKAPTIRLRGPAREAARHAGVVDISVSVTHEDDWAAAVAVALVEEEPDE